MFLFDKESLVDFFTIPPVLISGKLKLVTSAGCA